jgi:hypothetical protein
VDQRLRAALKHDAPDWRMLNSCPACFYKLEDEPALEFDWLVSIDGNNSLKRWDSMIYGSTRRVDSRKARSDYWIDVDDVDKFKSEVRVQVSNVSSRNVMLIHSIYRGTQMMIAGRMKQVRRKPILLAHLRASIAGVMLVRKLAKKCFRCLMNLAFLLHRVVIDS